MKSLLICNAAALLLTCVANDCEGQVLTSQYDNQRTGATISEKTLTPQNVNVRQFGKLGAYKVDGAVYAQPLYLSSVDVPGKGQHNVLFVATEHDSVYAFDADRLGDPPLWQVSLLDTQTGESPVPARSVQCPFIQPEIGITATPVVDRKTGTLYVLARSMVGKIFGDNQYFQRLHALAITTGAEKFGGPKLITGAVSGRGAGSANGQVTFDPLRENPRASLLLLKGSVFLTWASSCDVAPYHGWVMAYDAATLAQQAVFNVTPDGSEGGIWAADTGPAADSAGNVYFPTGNGTFDAASGGRDYGDTELKLSLQNDALVVRDYFTPYNQATINERDADLGSCGPLALPDQPGPHPRLLLQPTKAGTIYVLDRDQLGQYHPQGDAVLQRIDTRESYGAMAYWNGHVFFAASDDYLRDYKLENGRVTPSKSSAMKFENPGATPSVSADGNRNAVVWAISTKVWNGADNRAAVLYAFDAMDVTQPIYSSEQNSQRDRAGLATRFVFPVVVDGRVYFAARGEVDVYGLLH
jgi:hypothetical protein